MTERTAYPDEREHALRKLIHEGGMNAAPLAEVERLRLRVKFLEDELKCAEPKP